MTKPEPLPPKPPKRRVDPNGELPSRGFSTPRQRAAFERVKFLTDEYTAIRLYALVQEGGYTNFGTALEAAISQLRSKTEYDGIGWRFYCPECGFIGPSSATFAEAEWGASRHDTVDGCESVVFAYQHDDWDPENVEALVAAYQEDKSGRWG